MALNALGRPVVARATPAAGLKRCCNDEFIQASVLAQLPRRVHGFSCCTTPVSHVMLAYHTLPQFTSSQGQQR